MSASTFYLSMAAIVLAATALSVFAVHLAFGVIGVCYRGLCL